MERKYNQTQMIFIKSTKFWINKTNRKQNKVKNTNMKVNINKSFIIHMFVDKMKKQSKNHLLKHKKSKRMFS